MHTTKELGQKAENLAREYLVRSGYKIAETNWYSGHLELDIVAFDRNELVIVEVKSRSGIRYDHPAEAVTELKMKHLVQAADAYIEEKELEVETRFDVITVIFHRDRYELEHFKDAFYPTL